jgi:GAF domain-containing protein/signal transduction histidine kinase
MAANKEQRWAHQLTALNTIAVAVSQSLKLEHIIKVALSETMRALEIEFGWVYLLEEDELILKCHAGLSDELVNQIKELDPKPWITQKTLIRERLDEGPREIDEWRKREGIQSWLSVLLESKGEFVGCLALASRGLDCFGAPEVQFIETVRHQLGVAVENARLLAFAQGQENGLIKAYGQAERYAKDLKHIFEQERKRSLQLAALNAVTATVSRSLDLNTVLREALDKVVEVMKVEAGLVLLVNEQGELIPATYRGLPRKIAETAPPMKVGEGLSGKVAQSGKPLVVDDVSAHPELMTAEAGGEELKAWVSVPLIAKDKVLGTLDIATKKEHPFTPQDVQLLSSIGSQLGVAIENARLYEETQRRVQELAFLNETSRTMTSSLDMEQVLTTVLQEATDVLKVEATSILLLDDEDKELVLETVVGPEAEKTKGLRLPLGQGIAGWTAREGQPLLVPDVREDPRFYSGIDGATGFVTRSILAVPLTVKGKVIGVIEAVNKTEGDFSQTDVELLSSMTQSAAIAIENARLYEAIEGYSKTLEKKVALRTRNLAEEKSKLDAILHNIADGLLVIDTEDRLILANPMAARMLGFKLEKAIGHKIDAGVLGPLLRGFISDLVHQPDSASAPTLEIPNLAQIGPVRCWKQKDCQQTDCPAYGKTQTHCWSIPGTRCSPTDSSTLRRDSGQALRPFDGAQGRQDSGQALRQGLSRAQPRGSEQALRQGSGQVLRTDLAAPEESASEKTGDWHPLDCPFYRNLPRLSIEARASTVEDERGEVLGTVIVMRDITALKEMDRLKTLFVSNVSHELRTPITIIKLTVSNFLQYYARLEDQKKIELLETVKRQANILHRLIEDILTLSRLDAGKVFLEKVEFDLAAFCRTLLSGFTLAAAEKNISLIDDGLQEGTTVWADQERIGQVVRNLLSNAIKFTSDGGKVMITVRLREGDEGLVEMEVSDTGSGISPRDQAYLFERFYRGEAAAQGIPGTGLGLAIVREIVEEHGGSVSVESELGVGSTFTVLLPGRRPGDVLWSL